MQPRPGIIRSGPSDTRTHHRRWVALDATRSQLLDRRGRSAAVDGEDGRVRSLASLAYVVLGLMVASQHDYYSDLATVSRVVSAVVATALWPLILFGASLHLNLGLS